MRKQRKMGHVTIVSPSMKIVKERLDLLSNKENSKDKISATPKENSEGKSSDSYLPVMKDAVEVLMFHLS